MIDKLDNPKHHKKVATAISKQIFHCSPQLFFIKRHKPKLPPYPFSSSVLVNVNGNHFLLSAAHTFHEEDSHSIGIMINNNFCSVAGSLRYFEPNLEDDYDPHKADIAIYKLDRITVRAFKEKYAFLTSEKLGFNHNPFLDSRYLIFGYPAIKTQKYFPTKNIIPTSVTITSIGAGRQHYQENNFDIKK